MYSQIKMEAVTIPTPSLSLFYPAIIIFLIFF